MPEVMRRRILMTYLSSTITLEFDCSPSIAFTASIFSSGPAAKASVGRNSRSGPSLVPTVSPAWFRSDHARIRLLAVDCLYGFDLFQRSGRKSFGRAEFEKRSLLGADGLTGVD